MKLSTKIFLSTASVATLATLTVAGSTVSVDYTNSRAGIIRSLRSDLAQVDTTSVDALDQALGLSDYSQISVSIFFLDTNDKVATLDSHGGSLPSNTAPASLIASTKQPRQIGNLLVVAKPLSSGGYIAIGASTKSLDERTRQSILTLLAGYGFALVGILMLVWLILRRDLRSLRELERAASKIASGAYDVEIPAGRASTEIGKLRQALNSMVSSLTKALTTERTAKRNMEIFISDASHELRTPLTVIRGYAELLENQKTANPEIAGRIVSQVDRMNELVADLLLLAQLNEEASAKSATVWLDELALAAGEDLAILDPHRPLTFDISPVKLNSDKHLIQRFLANAVSNVSRYAPKTAAAKISVWKTEYSAHLRIEDGGPGLPAEAYVKGIQSFERFDMSRSRTAGGTGLGMSIMSSIARKLGGEVVLAKSTLGGLSVELQLPLNNAG